MWPIRGHCCLVSAAAGPGPEGLQGDPAGDTVEPAPDGAPLADGRGLTGQDQECGLEHILRVLGVPEHREGSVEYDPSVPLDQGSEGGPVPAGDEPGQEGVVWQAARSAGGHSPDEGGGAVGIGHTPNSPRLWPRMLNNSRNSVAVSWRFKESRWRAIPRAAKNKIEASVAA